jgi:hypothetical protein
VPTVSRCFFGRRGDGLGSPPTRNQPAILWWRGTKLGSPRTVFKFWRAAHQKVLSGGTNRPIVEKQLF